jgi:NADH dehydrogenase
MRVVIVGAGYAGLLCTFRLRRRCPPGCEITVVDRSDVFVERVRLHEFVAGAAPPTHELAPWLARRGVRFVRGSLEALDRRTRTITVSGAVLPYDRLVLALGSRVDDKSIEGAREFAHSFDRPLALRERVASLRDGHVLVIGAGLTAVEAASELREARPDLRVSLVHRGPVAPVLSDKARAYAIASLERLGVALVGETSVRAVTASGARTDRGEIAADLVLNCAGFCAPEALSSLELSTDSRGFLQVDSMLFTSDPDVMAVGDAASIEGWPALHKSCKSAMPMAAHAADNIVASLRNEPVAPFELRDTGVCVSLGRSDAVIQSYAEGRAPDGPVLTGRVAVWLKEMIVRYTTWGLRLEASQRLAYRWLRGPRHPTLAAESVA